MKVKSKEHESRIQQNSLGYLKCVRTHFRKPRTTDPLSASASEFSGRYMDGHFPFSKTPFNLGSEVNETFFNCLTEENSRKKAKLLTGANGSFG